jgi:KH/beta-lactamase-domain protein
MGAINRANSPNPGALSFRKLIVNEIFNALGRAEITSIEFEGPEIAVYVKNPKFIAENEDKVKELAKKLRKRVVVRTDPKARKPKDYTIRFILDHAPEDAGVNPSEMFFDEVLGEIRVLADKPGKLMGKGRRFAMQVLAETGWRLVAQRRPPPPLPVEDVLTVFAHPVVQAAERKRALREAGERIFRETIVGTRYIRVIGLGSFGEVGRSAILVDTGESKVLLDAGISPEGLGPEAFPYLDVPEFVIDELDAVVISHAHLDHIGVLPLLFKYGFRGPVYMTLPTRDIAYVVLRDYIELARKEGIEPPYTLKEINTMLTRVITVPYGVVTDVAPNIKLTFYDAGHILGSAVVHLHIGQGLHNILYTGDIKYYKRKNDKALRLLPPAHDKFQRVETLILESTYGATEQPPRDKAEEELVNLANKVYKRKGKLLIPVLAVGRAQDILAVLVNAVEKGYLPSDMPIYVDGMMRKITSIYTAYPELLSKPIADAILKEGRNPFVADNVVWVNDSSKRMEVIESNEPCIILSTSGMMQGGPVLEYFKYLAEDPKNALAFVSYQAPGTLGRRILEGEREIEMTEDSKLRVIKVKMEVVSIDGFSGHASRSELLYYLKNLEPKPRTIILNHGETNALASLALTIKSRWESLGFPSAPNVIVPENLEAIKLYPRTFKLHMI